MILSPYRGLKPTDCSPVYKSGGVTIHEQFLPPFPLSPLPFTPLHEQVSGMHLPQPYCPHSVEMADRVLKI